MPPLNYENTTPLFIQLIFSGFFFIRNSSILLRELGYVNTETSPSLPSLYTVEKPANTEEVLAATSTSTTAAVKQLLTLKSITWLLKISCKISPSTVQPVSVATLYPPCQNMLWFRCQRGAVGRCWAKLAQRRR